MALQTFRAGSPVDIPTADETAAAVHGKMHQFYAEQRAIESARDMAHVRAKKIIRRDAALASPAQTRFTAADGIAPESGYIWTVMLLTAQLASSSTFEAFITSDTATATTAANQRRLVAATTTNTQYPVFEYGKGRVPMFQDEGLFLNAGANIQAYFIVALQVPQEMEGELF